MSMVIAHNMPALNTLNQLGKNERSLSKALGQVSSGMKINNAGDDASAYAISERMRVQIRSLDQARANTQNGSSALRIAEGALNEMECIVRTMKERTINAANDTNTDEDRAIIQKELDQFVQQIDDISVETTFNGMKLLDGSFALRSPMDMTAEGLVLRGLNTWWIEQGLDYIEECYGISFATAKGVKEMEVLLEDDPGSGTLAYVTSRIGRDGYASKLTMTVNMDYFRSTISPENTNGGGSPNQYLDRVIAHELTHAVQSTNFTVLSPNIPDWYTEGIAELTHGGDERARNNLPVSGEITAAENNAGNNAMYGGGYITLRYLERQLGTGTIKKINQRMLEDRPITSTYFDNLLAGVSNGRYQNQASLFAAMRNDLAAAGNDDAFLRNYCGIDLYNNDKGSLLGTDALARPGRGMNEEDIINEGGGTYGRLPTGTSLIRGLTVKWPDIGASFKGGMAIQSDTKANRGVIFPIEKTDAGQLGIRNIDVGTQHAASRSISALDRAVDRLTDRATLIGSYLSRLEFTAANITTAHENTTNAESVIRDADMAATMTEYTKYSVLSQASQSMLAQANQNAGNVLSLLQ